MTSANPFNIKAREIFKKAVVPLKLNLSIKDKDFVQWCLSDYISSGIVVRQLEVMRNTTMKWEQDPEWILFVRVAKALGVRESSHLNFGIHKETVREAARITHKIIGAIVEEMLKDDEILCKIAEAQDTQISQLDIETIRWKVAKSHMPLMPQ